MDYEPNLDFLAGDVTHHVWRYNVEDFADAVDVSGLGRFRALATDGAGNTNALQLGWPVLTIDTDLPFLYDWNDTAANNQIEVGTSVDFSITVQDATTDVVSMRLEEMNVTDGGPWTPVTGDLAPGRAPARFAERDVELDVLVDGAWLRHPRHDLRLPRARLRQHGQHGLPRVAGRPGDGRGQRCAGSLEDRGRSGPGPLFG